MEVPSPGAGVLRKILRKAGDTVAVGEVIAEIEQRRRGSPGRTADRAACHGRTAGRRHRGDRRAGNGRPAAPEAVRAAPAARRAMADSGLAAEEVKGTGRGWPHLEART